MSESSQLLTVPMFIKAKTEDELVRLMIKNNIKSQITFKYFDIQKQGSFWYAWYLKDLSDQVRDKLNKEVLRDDP